MNKSCNSVVSDINGVELYLLQQNGHISFISLFSFSAFSSYPDSLMTVFYLLKSSSLKRKKKKKKTDQRCSFWFAFHLADFFFKGLPLYWMPNMSKNVYKVPLAFNLHIFCEDETERWSIFSFLLGAIQSYEQTLQSWCLPLSFFRTSLMLCVSVGLRMQLLYWWTLLGNYMCSCSMSVLPSAHWCDQANLPG